MPTQPEPSTAHAERQLPMRDRLVGLFLLVGIVALLVYLRTPEEPSPIAGLLLPPVEALGASWQSTAPESEGWAEAMAAYASERYGAAAAQLETIAGRAGTDASLAQLYLGSSYLLEARPRNAELALRLAARSADDRIAREARWQLAISSLRQEEIETARSDLEELARGEGAHAAEARALLERLAARSSRFP